MSPCSTRRNTRPADPAEVGAWLDGNSTKGLLTNLSAVTPDKLLFTGGL
ncbi:hypothetical protein [Streptomyces sp. NBC_00691]|nr:hypothetical protein [Streptomyces sp. NBC_00691]